LGGNEARPLANLRSDTEFAGRFFVELAGDCQILSLLIRTNSGSGPQTEYTIHLPAVVSVVQQSLLHPIYIVRMWTADTLLLGAASEVSSIGRDPEIPVASNEKTIPAHATLLAKNIHPQFVHQAIDSFTRP